MGPTRRPPNPLVSLPSEATSCNSRSEARQDKTRAGSVTIPSSEGCLQGGVGMEHVTKRVGVITPHRAPVVLRFLLNDPEETLCVRPKPTTRSHPTTFIRSAETGEIEGADCQAAAFSSSYSGLVLPDWTGDAILPLLFTFAQFAPRGHCWHNQCLLGLDEIKT